MRYIRQYYICDKSVAHTKNIAYKTIFTLQEPDKQKYKHFLWGEGKESGL